MVLNILSGSFLIVFLRFMHDTTILFKKINKKRIINKFDVNDI